MLMRMNARRPYYPDQGPVIELWAYCSAFAAWEDLNATSSERNDLAYWWEWEIRLEW